MKKAIPFIVIAVCALLVITTSIAQYVALHPQQNTPNTPTTSTTPPEVNKPNQELSPSIMPDGFYALIAGNLHNYVIEQEYLDALMTRQYFSLNFQNNACFIIKQDTPWAFEEHGGVITISTDAIKSAFEITDVDEIMITYDASTDLITLVAGDKTGYFKRFDNMEAAKTWFNNLFTDVPIFELPLAPDSYEQIEDNTPVTPAPDTSPAVTEPTPSTPNT